MSISRISVAEAQELIKVDDDLTGAPAVYFTLTPSIDSSYPASEGWDAVTYYTNRPKRLKLPKGITNCQWIYVLTNETMPGLVKIGYTKNMPTDRVKQINSATGVALDFVVEWAFPCFNAHDLEQEIHHYLQNEGFRVNNKKEFFTTTVEEAKSVITRIGKPYEMS
jgi:hypothetical protein